jgi:hypothetical protein
VVLGGINLGLPGTAFVNYTTAHAVVSNSTMHNMKEDAKNAAVDAGVKKMTLNTVS